MLDMIKQRRMMQTTIAILVLLNLALITTMIINRPPGPGEGSALPMGFEHFLRTELDLSTTQMDALHDIRAQHFEDTYPMMEMLADSLDALIEQAFDPATDSIRVNELVRNISNIHVDMDMGLYRHFTALNALCTPEQQESLRDLAGKLMRANSPPPPQGGQSAARRPPPAGDQGQERRPPPPGGQSHERRPPAPGDR